MAETQQGEGKDRISSGAAVRWLAHPIALAPDRRQR